MNIEVEIKVKIDNFTQLKEKLPAFGQLVKAIRQIDEYYVPHHRDFFNQKPHPIEWLRIRTNPDKVVFEYDRSVNKRADGLQDYAEEYESEISHPDEFRKILQFLDFKKVTTVDKQREYWNCGDFEIALDNVEGLGCFIEVEARDSFENAILARQKCIDFANKLGVIVNEEDLIKVGYPVMLIDNKSQL